MAATPAHFADQTAGAEGILDLIISVGLMAVMMFTALAFGTVEPWSLAIFGLLVITLLFLWMIKGVVNRGLKVSVPSTALPLAALLLLGILQGVAITDSAGKRFSISLDAEATWLTVEVLLVLLISFLLSANFLTDTKKLTWLGNFLIFFGLALAVFALVQRFTWNGKYFWMFEPSVPPPAPFGPFVNHNHFAGYVEMIAPIPAALILRRAVRGEFSFLYGFATVMMGLAVVMSLSRGGMISLVAGLMFVAAFGIKPAANESFGVRRRGGYSPSNPLKWPVAFSRIGAMVVMVFTIGVGVWWVGADSVIKRMQKGELVMDAPSKDPAKETFFQSRGWIWRDTAAMIRENWVTGIGLGAYHTAYPIYSTRDGTLVVSQAHNDYLQILADGGILGAVIALWFIFLVARDTVRASRHGNPLMAGMAVGAAGGLFALLVHSLFDFNFQIPSNALLFLVLTSVVAQIATSVGKSDRAAFEHAA
ncbi:MAG: O-antigen ligase family protein [Blastocatellales bacterium]